MKKANFDEVIDKKADSKAQKQNGILGIKVHYMFIKKIIIIFF